MKRYLELATSQVTLQSVSCHFTDRRRSRSAEDDAQCPINLDASF